MTVCATTVARADGRRWCPPLAAVSGSALSAARQPSLCAVAGSVAAACGTCDQNVGRYGQYRRSSSIGTQRRVERASICGRRSPGGTWMACSSRRALTRHTGAGQTRDERQQTHVNPALRHDLAPQPGAARRDFQPPEPKQTVGRGGAFRVSWLGGALLLSSTVGRRVERGDRYFGSASSPVLGPHLVGDGPGVLTLEGLAPLTDLPASQPAHQLSWSWARGWMPE
jgi:hypothetical protein